MIISDSSEDCKQVVPCKANSDSEWDVSWTNYIC